MTVFESEKSFMKNEHWHECSFSDFKEIIKKAKLCDDTEKFSVIRRQLYVNEKYHKFYVGVEELTLEEIETRDQLFDS